MTWRDLSGPSGLAALQRVGPHSAVGCEQLLVDLVTDSYRLVVAALPRRLRPIDPETFEGPLP